MRAELWQPAQIGLEEIRPPLRGRRTIGPPCTLGLFELTRCDRNSRRVEFASRWVDIPDTQEQGAHDKVGICIVLAAPMIEQPEQDQLRIWLRPSPKLDRVIFREQFNQSSILRA